MPGCIDLRPLPDGFDPSTLWPELEAAVDPADLRPLVRAVYRLFDAGLDEGQALTVMQQLRERLEAQGRPEQDADAVLDVMDFLTGFCAPEAVVCRAHRDHPALRQD